MKRARAVAAIAALVCGFGAQSALADTVQENNDAISKAYGPLASGVTYDGTFDERGDGTDLEYLKVVPSGTSITVTVTNTTTGCSQACGIGLRVVDGNDDLTNNGSDVFSPNTILPGESRTVTAYSLTAGTSYYVNPTTSAAGNAYSVTVAGTTGSPPSNSGGNSNGGSGGNSNSGSGGNSNGGSGGNGNSGAGTGEPSSCVSMAQDLATLDQRRNTDKAGFDAARAAFAKARSKADKATAKAEMDRKRNQLLTDLKDLSDQLKAMAKAGCRCSIGFRMVDRQTATLAPLKRAIKTLRSRSRSRARARQISVLTNKARALQRAIDSKKAELKRDGCPSYTGPTARR